MASAVVQQAISKQAVALGHQLLRHGGHPALVQDVLHSLSNWAARKYARRLSAAVAGAPVAPDDLLDTSANLAGEQLDGALATLRLLSSRLAALSGMAHEPHSSCSSDPGLTIGTKSWLLPHRIEDQRYWQYGYELRFTNSSEEPLQLLNKTWQVTELSGALRSRSSSMLLGMQPVIYSGDSVAFKSAITLDNIKGSMKGQFICKGLVTGSLFPATVAALALTPTQQQYSDKHYMPTDMLRPSAQPHQQQAVEGADAAPQSEKQHLEHGTASAATAASWKSML